MGTSVGENTKIKNSVIGRNCKIGKNDIIDGSIIWDGVTIQDNVTVVDSLICDNVMIKSSSNINEGCVISFDVIVGDNISLEPFTKLTLHTNSQTKNIHLGEDGIGYCWDPKKPLPLGTELGLR